MPAYCPTYPVYQPERRPWKLPQIEFEQYQLARRWDGVDDDMQTGIGACSTLGALTFAAFFRPTVLGFLNNIMHNSQGTTPRALLQLSSINTVALSIAGTSVSMASPAVGLGEWVWVVATKAAGTTTPRGHLFKNNAWTHADLSATLIDPQTAQTTIRFLNIGSLVFYSGDIAVAAQWNGVALSDSQVEEFTTNRRTLDVYNCSGGTPAGLWEFNQPNTGVGVVDLAGNGADINFLLGTEVMTDGPTPWTYLGAGDGSGFVQQPRLTQRAVVPV